MWRWKLATGYFSRGGEESLRSERLWGEGTNSNECLKDVVDFGIWGQSERLFRCLRMIWEIGIEYFTVYARD